MLYECQGAASHLVTMSRRGGHVCNNHNNPEVPCNAVVAVWTRGSQVSVACAVICASVCDCRHVCPHGGTHSAGAGNNGSNHRGYAPCRFVSVRSCTHCTRTQGFTFPPDVGYPFESSLERFYLMESHYNNPVRADGDWEAAVAAQHLGPVVDNSGLKLVFTPSLRKHDAGVVSIGERIFTKRDCVCVCVWLVRSCRLRVANFGRGGALRVRVGLPFGISRCRPLRAAVRWKR